MQKPPFVDGANILSTFECSKVANTKKKTAMLGPFAQAESKSDAPNA